MSDDIDAFALRENFEKMKKRRHECDEYNKAVTFIEWQMQEIAELEASLETANVLLDRLVGMIPEGELRAAIFAKQKEGDA